MPKKAPLSNTQKAELCAQRAINAAHDFQYLGFDIKDIGIPPPSACAASCSGHGISDYCVICRFNGCKICGKSFSRIPVFWKGRCGGVHTGVMNNYPKHTARVEKILVDKAGDLPAPIVVVAPVPKAPKAAKAAKVPKAPKAAKAAKAPKPVAVASRISSKCPFKVGRTTSKLVRSAGGWTLKMSVELKAGDV